MRIVELLNNISLPINNEESSLLKRFTEGVVIAKRELDEREQVIANQLVVKDVLLRINENGKIQYKRKIKSDG